MIGIKFYKLYRMFEIDVDTCSFGVFENHMLIICKTEGSVIINNIFNIYFKNADLSFLLHNQYLPLFPNNNIIEGVTESV